MTSKGTEWTLDLDIWPSRFLANMAERQGVSADDVARRAIKLLAVLDTWRTQGLEPRIEFGNPEASGGAGLVPDAANLNMFLGAEPSPEQRTGLNDMLTSAGLKTSDFNLV